MKCTDNQKSMANSKRFILLLLSVFFFQSCFLKEGKPDETVLSTRFEKEIEAFERQDKRSDSEKIDVLFVGSSSIRMWATLREDMQPFKVLNRGFGGATTAEVLQYYNRIIQPHQPEIFVIYVGENDIAEGVKPDETAHLNALLFNKIEQDFSGSKIIYISMKPSIARWNLWTDFQEGNQKIEDLCHSNPDWHYIESADMMLNRDETIRRDIFIEDGLHMNEKGYKIWTEVVKNKIIVLQSE